MITRLVNRTSLTIKVALVAAISILAVCATLAMLYGISSRALTQDFVQQRGQSEANLIAAAAYGPTRFNDEATVRTILQDALDASDKAGVAAVILKSDGSAFASLETQTGAAEALTAKLRARLDEAKTTDIRDGTLIATPIHKPGAEHSDTGSSVGVLAFDWRPDVAMAQAHAAEVKAVLASLIVAAIVLALTIVAVKLLMIRPLDLQRRNIGRISEGNFDLVPADGDRTDEIGAIAASVEELRVTLQSAAETQRDSSYKGAAFNAASAALMVADLDYKIRYVNPAMVALLGKFQQFIPQLAAGVTLDRLTQMTMDDFHANGAQVRGRLRHLGGETMKIMIAFGKSRVSLQISQVRDLHDDPMGLIMEWSDVTNNGTIMPSSRVWTASSCGLTSTQMAGC